jgi:hypothetical protein
MYAALSVLVFFLIARELSTSMKVALAATAIFAFASPHFGSHAGGYWSHNTGGFFLLLGVWLLAVAYGRFSWLSAVPLTMALVVRPDMIIAVAFTTGYIFLKHRAQFWRFAVVGAVLGSLYIGHCQWIYGEWIQPYQGPVDEVKFSGSQILASLAGLTVSPSRGLFIFTPVLIFALIGFGVAWFRHEDGNSIVLLIGGVALLHLLFNALWPVWWAGWSFGSRFFAGVAGLWVLMLLPVLENGKKPILILITVLSLFGVGVQYRCVSDRAVHAWNKTPTDINDDLDRLWDWSDMQMFRGWKAK